MTYDEADKIVQIWGVYLEYCQDRLRALFMACVPESLLPYPPETIEKALNIIAKHYHDIGDHEASELIKSTFGALVLYDKDEEAIENAVSKFNIPEVRDAIISNMKKVQKDWIKTQI